ncbi:hypothetical protein D3C74_324380 [compost metagenome]
MLDLPRTRTIGAPDQHLVERRRHQRHLELLQSGLQHAGKQLQLQGLVPHHFYDLVQHVKHRAP